MSLPKTAFACLLGFWMAAPLPSFGFGQTPKEQQVKSFSYGEALPPRNKEGDSLNLFTNGNFGDGMKGWSVRAGGKKGQANIDAVEKHEGHSTLRVFNPAPDNTFVTQKVTVKPATRYRLSCWVKTHNIAVKQGRGNAGATLWIDGGWEATKAVKDAEDWTRLEMEFDSGKRTEIQAGPRLGQWGGILTGTAWFSEISIEEIAKPGN